MPTVHFHALATGGEGVGKLPDGKTIFAPFVLPGERAQVEILEAKKSFARGQILEILDLSPNRITPPCPYFRPETPTHSCGGCAWQHLELGAQRTAKIQIVRDLLERIGGQKVELEIEGGEGFGYRNKAVFGVHGTQIGFHAHASHDLISIEECPIQRAENNETLRAIRTVLTSEFKGAFSQILARVSSTGQRVVGLYGTDFERAKTFGARLRNADTKLDGVFWRHPESGKPRPIWGETRLVEFANDLQFEVEGEGFWQINSEIAPRMALAALEFAGEMRGQNVLDLYCGSGFFALHFARAGAKVWGVEFSPQAIENAKTNAYFNDLEAHFQSGDAAKIARQFAPKFFDTILLDPPRAGAKSAIPVLQRLAPRQLIYVSCDPATLARDVKSFAENYQITRARAFDLFPQTAHVETILKLERREP